MMSSMTFEDFDADDDDLGDYFYGYCCCCFWSELAAFLELPKIISRGWV